MGNHSQSSLSRGIGSAAGSKQSKEVRDTHIVEPAEVIDIILDEEHSMADNNPKNIGKIQIRRTFSDFGVKEDSLPWASALLPGGGRYPIKHEQVLIVQGPNPLSGVSYGKPSLYYLGPINIYGLENYGPIPGTGINMTKEAEQKQGPFGRVAANFTGASQPQDTVKQDITFGDTFLEKDTIKLRAFEGDRIFEGRWGQSIRFGSTIKGLFHWFTKDKTTWSKRSDGGDPIIILRNGEPEDIDITKSLVENIDKDPSSIYITSTQLINIDLGNPPLKTYGLNLEGETSALAPIPYIPQLPHTYKGESQIILNSDRLILNAKKDAAFLNAEKSISLSTKGTINLNCGQATIIDGPEIHLGVGSREPGVLGDQLVNLLRELLNALQTADIVTPVGPGLAGPSAQADFSGLIAKLNSILCKKVWVE